MISIRIFRIKIICKRMISKRIISMCNVYDQLSLMTLMISDQLHGDKKGEWP